MTPPRRSLAPDPGRPIALVLSGGGARGAFQVGVWQVLREHPRGLGGPPDVISGTSAGALNGALIAAGVAPHDMLEFWLDLGRRPPVVANRAFFRSAELALATLALREPARGLRRRLRELAILRALLGKHGLPGLGGILAAAVEFLLTARFDTVSELLDRIHAHYLFDTAPAEARLAALLGAGVCGGPTRLAINTVDIRTGTVVRIVSHRPAKHPRSSTAHYRYEPCITPRMIMGSAAIPLLFRPTAVGEHLLWDGGLLVNTPMAPAVALGATRIIPVLVTPRIDGVVHDEPDTLGRAIEHLANSFLENAYNVDRKLLLERNAVAAQTGDPHLREVELFRAIRPLPGKLFGALSYLYFEPTVLREMYAAGQEAARAWLSRGPALDSRRRVE